MDIQEIVLREFLGAQLVYDRAGAVLDMRGRFAAGIVIPLNGCIIFTPNGCEPIRADAHAPLFLPEGACYRNACAADAESILINLRTAQEYREILPLTPLLPEEAREYYRRIDTLQKRYRPGTRQELFSVLYSLLARLLRPSEEGVHAADEIIVPAIEAALAGYRDPDFSCTDMARAARISEPYLRRLFVRHTGLSPFRYLTRIRMEQAALLIRAGRTVGETALSVGYGDVYQFSRAYRKHFGYAPSSTARE